MKQVYCSDPSFRGTVFVTRKSEILYDKSFGYADLPNEVPNQHNTRFATASAGKAFVAVGILQLIEKKQLSFEDTLGKLLPIDLHKIDPEVTVRELLTHTSGVPDYFDESVMEEYEELWTDFPNYKIRHNKDLLPLFIDKPMMYPRGERFQYNNSGYVILAMIIEQVTGEEFDAYLKKNVFDVCGMTDTGYFELDRLPARCANNYIYCEDTKDYRTNIFSVDVKGTGAGGAFTTVEDITKFWNGLSDHLLLSEDMVKQMFSRQSGEEDEDDESDYGYGVWLIPDKATNRFIPYFQGCDPGVSFISVYDPTDQIISVVVSNYGDDVWQEMHKIRECFYK